MSTPPVARRATTSTPSSARRKVADGMLPALTAVTPDHVHLVAPARWMPVLETAPDVALLPPR